MKLLILTQKVDQNDDVLGFFHGWICEFAKHYEKVTVIALGVGEYDLPKNVHVLSLGKERQLRKRTDLGNSKKSVLVEQLRKLKYILLFYYYIIKYSRDYDAVFVHMNPIYVVFGGFFWRAQGKKVALWYTHKQVDLKLRIAEKLANIIFTASRESFRLHSKKVLVMGHGINVEMFMPQEKNGDGVFNIVTAGRISPVKDYETLLRAVQILAQEKFSFDVMIIGDVVMNGEQEYLERLKSFVCEKNIEKHVTFVGSVPNRALPEYLGKADLFVNMSQTGSLDKAVLEAMSCGVPVVTSSEAFRDVLDTDSEMLMFQKGDINDFAKKIKTVHALSDIEKQNLAKRLRDIIVEKHSLAKLIPRILNSYETSR